VAARTVQEFFAPQFLERLERLSLVSRRPFRGRLAGERKSPRKGQSVEFFDYRPYGVGDDLRYVDWNIFGRLDRLHVKLFLDEEDLCVHLLVDGSASMAVGGKLACAIRLAGALGFVALVSLERVGAALLRERVAETWPATRGRRHFVRLLEFLSQARPEGATGLARALEGYAIGAREPGVAVVLSDLLDPAGYERGLRALVERRFDVHVLHVLAPEEVAPPFGGDLRLRDSETGELREVTLDVEGLRAYRQRLQRFLDGVEGFCRGHEIGYRRIVSDASVEAFVLSELKGLILT
jgi:uncharacterized protein (DUF58 family)